MRLDRQLIVDLGLGALPEPDQREVLDAIVNAMQISTGARIVEALPVEPFDRFADLRDAGDDAGALALLNEHVPHHQQIVAEQYEHVCAWIRSHARAILRSVPQEATTAGRLHRMGMDGAAAAAGHRVGGR